MLGPNSQAERVGQLDATTLRTEVAEVGMYLYAPRLTTSERDALTASNGMVIYNTTTNKFQGYEGGAWANLI